MRQSQGYASAGSPRPSTGTSAGTSVPSCSWGCGAIVCQPIRTRWGSCPPFPPVAWPWHSQSVRQVPQETCDGQGADTRYREQEAALRKSSCNGGQAVFPHRDLPLEQPYLLDGVSHLCGHHASSCRHARRALRLGVDGVKPLREQMVSRKGLLYAVDKLLYGYGGDLRRCRTDGERRQGQSFP